MEYFLNWGIVPVYQEISLLIIAAYHMNVTHHALVLDCYLSIFSQRKYSIIVIDNIIDNKGRLILQVE